MKISLKSRKTVLSLIAGFLASVGFVVFFGGVGGDVGNYWKTDVLSADEGGAYVFSTNIEGNFIGANGPFCYVVGKSCANISNYKVFDIISIEDVAEFASVHAKLFQNGEGADGLGPFLFNDRNDKTRLFLLNARPQVKDSKVEEIIFIARDLTDYVKILNAPETESSKDENDESFEDMNWFKKFYQKEAPKLLVDNV